MTHKERMLATLRGQPVDRLPFVPRLDLWYNANKLAGTLPDRLAGASLFDVADELDVGFHAVVPNFRDLRGPQDDLDRGLGLYRLRTFPHRTELRDVQRIVQHDGDRTFVEYRTPVGSIRTGVLFDDQMRKAGITITHICEYAIKEPADYEVVGFIFENAEVVAEYDNYRAFQEQVGDRGLAIAFTNLAASPVHLLQRELVEPLQFFYEMHDHPDELTRCAERIQIWFDRAFAVTADSPAEVVFSGANYDATMTYPPFFAEHIAPALARQADVLHANGKFLLTHTDGENRGLLEHYVDSRIDIADSICPKPMTSLTVKDVREVFGDRITIWGGIPSVSVLENSMSDRDFEAHVEKLLADLGRGDHMILSIADTTPPAAKFSRIERICELAKQFGPVSGPEM